MTTLRSIALAGAFCAGIAWGPVAPGGRQSRAHAGNVVVGGPAEGLPGANAQFVGADRNLALGDLLHVKLPGPQYALLARGRDIVRMALAEKTEGQVTLEEGEGQPRVEVAVEPPPDETDLAWPATESYALSRSVSGVRIVAPTERGAFYGLMAVPELLNRKPRGEWQLLAAEPEGVPRLPFRGTYMAGLPRNPAERIVWCQRFAALRLNAVVFEDDIWWDLDDDESRRIAQDAFADFRSYGLEPIPELQSFGWAHIILAKNPMLAEGTWVQRERLVLRSEEPVALAEPNVLRTSATDLRIEDLREEAYEEGRDYEVIDGKTEHVYRPDAEPYRIRRLPGSRIPDGATVYASYDYVSRVNSQDCPYCPSEPQVAEIMVPAIRNTVEYLSPKYVHIGHDEPAQINTDSRCQKRWINGRRVTNAELFAEDVNRLDAAAKEMDPNVRLMMWADAVNPYHNGLQFPTDPTADALPRLPKDSILNVWFYGPDQPLHQGADSLRYFGRQGFATTGSPWDDPLCAERWVAECLNSRGRGEECMGVLYTSWGDRWGGLEACATAAWRPPTAAAPER